MAAQAIPAGLTDERRRLLRQTMEDPSRFSRKMLQSAPWSGQDKIMQAVAKHRRVAVKACHASGKTYTAAELVLWFLARHPECVVVTTAPTWGQVEKLLWGELHAALRRSRYPFPKALSTELHLGPKRYAYGLSTTVQKEDEGVKFQGIHAQHVLIILDEAPGVDPKIWQAAEAALSTGNAHLLAAGNPTVSSGPLVNAFTTDRALWHCITISAFDTPNLAGLDQDSLMKMGAEQPDLLDSNPNPHLVTRRWCWEMVKKWGWDHPFVQARVLGEFPKQDEFSLISLAWLEKNKDVAIAEEDQSQKITAGIDVAGPGEAESVGYARRGRQVVSMEVWPESDPRGSAVRWLKSLGEDLGGVNVDSCGIGWGFYLHLTDCGFAAYPVNVGDEPRDKEKFANLKAEYYWNLREDAKEGRLNGLVDETTIGQLAGIRWKLNPRGKILIESKEDAAKRGVPSPDRAEAVMLCYASNGMDIWANL